MASVRLEHVSKVYDSGVIAVRDLSLDVADKEFVILVGPTMSKALFFDNETQKAL